MAYKNRATIILINKYILYLIKSMNNYLAISVILIKNE